MTARSEAPASFRSSSVRPGALSLIRGRHPRGPVPTAAHRLHRPGRHQEEAARTRCWATCGGSSTRCSRCSSTPCFVTLIFHRQIAGLRRCSCSRAILPWKWFDSTVKDGVSSVTPQDRLIKQIYFPKLVLPVSTSRRASSTSRSGWSRCSASRSCFYPRTGQRVAAAHAGRRGRPVRVLAGGRDRAVRGQRLLPRRRATSRDTCSGSGSTCRRRCTAPELVHSSSRRRTRGRRHLQPQPVDRTCSTSYRNLTFYGQPPRWSALAILCRVAGPARGSRSCCSSGSSPRSPRSCDATAADPHEPAGRASGSSSAPTGSASSTASS